jgi:hypothetical protein
VCTLVLSVEPSQPWRVLLAATRDEFRARPWEPPAAWWPQEHPGVIGGRDLEAGGTWMALAPREPRIAVLLNRIEPSPLSDAEAMSRGGLPLLAAARGIEAVANEDLSRVRPFNLAVLEPGRVVWWRYDGADLSRHLVPPGVHMLTAADLDDMSNPRQRFWLPAFEAAEQPAPRASDRAPAGWGGWPELLADVDSPYDDPRALNVRRDDLAFGTVSASLAAIGEEELRYEFCPGPPDRTEWERVV